MWFDVESLSDFRWVPLMTHGDGGETDAVPRLYLS